MNARQIRAARRLRDRLIRHKVPVRFRKWWADGFAHAVLNPVQRARLPQVDVLMIDGPLRSTVRRTRVSLWNLQAETVPLKRAPGVEGSRNG